jgi:hypothetical protein
MRKLKQKLKQTSAKKSAQNSLLMRLIFLAPKATAKVTASAIFFSLILLGSLPFSAGAAENLGRIEVSDIFLEPIYTNVEPHQGSFSLGSSYLGASWTIDSVLSAQLKFGSRDLINSPIRYGPTTSLSQLAIVEAYAQADSEFGLFRLGMIPLYYGLEGGDVERELYFPRSLIYQARYIGLRDFGGSYHISSDGFTVDSTIHNGEGGADLDNELWLTTRLSWSRERHFRLGISGQVGRTTPLSTYPTGKEASGPAWVDVTQAARYRIVNAFVHWLIQPVQIEAEATAGDVLQGDNIIKTRALHADFVYITRGSLDWLLRYDILDPRNDLGSDQLTEISLGLAWRSAYRNSVLTLLGTKRIQQDTPPDVHRVMLIWRMAPIIDR